MTLCIGAEGSQFEKIYTVATSFPGSLFSASIVVEKMSTRPTLPPIPNTHLVNLPDSGRHVTRLNQGLFSTTMEAEKRDPGNEVDTVADKQDQQWDSSVDVQLNPGLSTYEKKDVV